MSCRDFSRAALGAALAAAVVVGVTHQAQARTGGGGSGVGPIGGMGGETTTLAPGRPPRSTPAAPPAAAPNYGQGRRWHIYVPGQYANTTGNTATGLPK